jgi:hypothetical protein
MAGSQQRPTDDVLGHGRRLPPEDDTAGSGDGGNKRPDDVEGHMPFRRAQDAEAVDEDEVGDDTEGHGVRVRLGQDAEAVDEDQVADDTEGHGSRFNG